MDIRLKEIRESRGLKQQDVADALGVKVSRYGTWERGERMPSLEQAYNCAVILNCSIDEIAGVKRTDSVYADPREAELHAYYAACSPDRRERIVETARDAAGMSREGSADEAAGADSDIPASGIGA